MGKNTFQIDIIFPLKKANLKQCSLEIFYGCYNLTSVLESSKKNEEYNAFDSNDIFHEINTELFIKEELKDEKNIFNNNF